MTETPASPATKSPFEKLVEKNSVFKFKNKTSISQTIYLKGGDSIFVPENATVSVQSKNLLNMPDATLFKMIVPTAEQMIEVGYLTKNPTVKVK